MATIIAALVAASVATFGYVITVWAKLLEDRRNTYAQALAAVHAYQELPYRIRRRPDSSPATRGELGKVISEVQKDLDFYISLLKLDSHQLGDAYEALVQASREKGKEHRDEAWKQPPARRDTAMGFPEIYEYEDEAEAELCIERMRQHLRLLPLWRSRS
jgi:hypothetical protein